MHTDFGLDGQIQNVRCCVKVFGFRNCVEIQFSPLQLPLKFDHDCVVIVDVGMMILHQHQINELEFLILEYFAIFRGQKNYRVSVDNFHSISFRTAVVRSFS